MSTLKEKCNDCWVESVDENSVCYAGKHRIHYCSLHDSAPQLREALQNLLDANTGLCRCEYKVMCEWCQARKIFTEIEKK